MEVLEKLSGESMREYIIRILKSNIINLNLEPGQNISEAEIAEELGVSRTPVREAFITLSQEKLLEIYPQKGTYISLIDLNMVEEARFLRLTLEKAIVKLACDHLTDQFFMELEENLHRQEFFVKNKIFAKLLELDNQFHRILFKACQKERTYAMIESVNTHFNRVRMLRLAASLDVEQIVSQHREILKAIQKQDSVEAENIMGIHLTGLTIEQELLEQQYPHYFK